MRKIGIWVIATSLMMSAVSCNQKTAEGGNENGVSNVADSLSKDASNDSLEIGTISDLDLWLQINPSDLKTENLKRLADAYNAKVIVNSIFTDFDLQMRFDSEHDSAVEAITNMEISIVHDAETLSKLKEYKKEMLYLLSDNPGDVDQEVHNPWKAKGDIDAFLSEKYSVNTFGKLVEDKYWEEYNSCQSVPEWSELREKRGDDKMVDELKTKYQNAKDFDARCIYAIELAHAYQANIDSWGEDDKNPAIPIMESLMKERIYSLYLNELWQKWRTLYQNSEGDSKDSVIPNNIYNTFRNICACTILSHIEGHPNDIKAINEFLVIAWKENILREGGVPYGNQNIIEMSNLFPEVFEKEQDE